MRAPCCRKHAPSEALVRAVELRPRQNDQFRPHQRVTTPYLELGTPGSLRGLCQFQATPEHQIALMRQAEPEMSIVIAHVSMSTVFHRLQSNSLL